MQRILGLVGRKQHGKTTVANMLVAMGYFRVGFAAVLKDMCEALGVPMDELTKEIPLEHLCNRSPRYIMQTLGTEWGRDIIGDDIWLRAWGRRTADILSVVADDIRFPNEASYIKDKGGLVYKIVRPNFDVGTDSHSSESLVDNCLYHRVFINDGTIDDLLSQVMEALVEDEYITIPGV